jgi:signal transduction histidine kinase
LCAAVTYALAFWVTTAQAGRERRSRAILPLLALQSFAALVMFHLACTMFETFLLVVVAAQLGLFLAVPSGLGWVGAQTGALCLLGIGHFGLRGGVRWAFVHGLTLQVMALFISFFGAIQARARHELARVNSELQANRELLADAREAAARGRIARELHDLLGHHLSALSLHLEVAHHRAGEGTRDLVDRCQSIARLLLSDVRQAVGELRESRSESLPSRLRRVVAGIPQPHIELTLEPDVHTSEPEREQAVLRCVQEIVTNTIRHAGANNLRIDVSVQDERLALTARDDGRGASELTLGQGLAGMRERLLDLGGSIDVNSQAGNGFEVRAHLPWPKRS